MPARLPPDAEPTPESRLPHGLTGLAAIRKIAAWLGLAWPVPPAPCGRPFAAAGFAYIISARFRCFRRFCFSARFGPRLAASVFSRLPHVLRARKPPEARAAPAWRLLAANTAFLFCPITPDSGETSWQPPKPHPENRLPKPTAKLCRQPKRRLLQKARPQKALLQRKQLRKPPHQPKLKRLP